MSLDVYLTIPFKNEAYGSSVVFEMNVTANLVELAKRVGLYKCLWKPHEIGIVKADDAINLLEAGLGSLKRYPAYYKQFEHPSGYGNYNWFVKRIELYLEACKKYPDASIK